MKCQYIREDSSELVVSINLLKAKYIMSTIYCGGNNYNSAPSEHASAGNGKGEDCHD